MAEPARLSFLADAAAEALAHGQPGQLAVRPLWTSDA